MRRRKNGPKRWVMVPALASLGVTLVAYGQNLVLEDVSMAAPAVEAAAAAARPGARPDPKATPVAQATGSASAANPEFGGPGTAGPVQVQVAPTRIRSTSQDDLVRRARESSGREDPFVSLLLPQAVVIQPVFIPTPPPPTQRTVVPQAPPRRFNQVTQRYEIRQMDGTWTEETIAANPNEPRWTVQGILNTGRESLVILEVDGVTREAHIGEVLEDGSKVVAISGSQVTLLSAGRRYVKQIGGLDQ